jgi:hypothetical protein
MTNEHRTDEFLRAAGAVGALLPQFASAAIGITFIAYFVGWRAANAYFTTLGAPWVVLLLPPSYFLYSSSELVIGIFLFALIAVHAIATGTIQVKVLVWCSALALVIAAIFIALSIWLPPTSISPKRVLGLSTLAGLCYAVGSGATLGEVVYRLKESELRWTVSHAYLIYFAAFYGLYMLPSHTGSAKAKYHLETLESVLPSVRLITPSPNENWRLVETIGESALLMDHQMASTQPLFRIVKTTDMLSINATDRKQ